ncbi:hypothetical protein HYH02_000033 [Chlamydomonas schloesseri]|uniref:ATP-dependent Clp protease proteolytic subunit n=1 Tax=Chlamydomonas schloesseri TaxID=2026947 RepID=A0A835WMH1_9CHLO|nr:hypothetical protein HYH02_000033 [Chlamydomonas schloesseri]|eukprot:KAG2449929.1 hypothetical protein HYH02_000033 [Chlamydomonas schloesseri]
MATLLQHGRLAVGTSASTSSSVWVPPVPARQPCVNRQSLGASTRSSRRNVEARGIRRSPVVTPDIQIGHGEDAIEMDLYRYLLTNRIIFIGGYINDKMATQIVGSLMALEAVDENEDIRIYINSPGGQPYSVLGVVDAIQSIKPDVQTVALGACYSYASLVVAAGTKGKRYAMKNTRLMMTQPMGGSQGDIYQIKATVEELNALYQIFSRYYMKFTGMTQDQIEQATCRDHFMTPEQAKMEGLIDEIIRGKGDYTVPPAIVRQFREVGLVDDLTPGPFLKTDCN